MLSRRCFLSPGLTGSAALLSACRSRGTTRPPEVDDARLFAGMDGAPLDLADVLRAMQSSDVVLVGEQHGHPLGLDLAATLFEQLLAGPAGARAGLGLEFFERDQQEALDRHLRGELDEAGLRAATRMEGPKKYPEGHRRMVEAARRAGRPVLAANAPRRLVKLARTDGLDALAGVPAQDRALVEVPATLTEGRYRERFFALMGDGHAGVDAATLEGFYRAQNVWDATMAGTVVRGLERGLRPFVLVVGGFHVDFGGGLLARLRAARADASVYTLSMVDAWATRLRAEDSTRADAVAYVGPTTT